MVRDMPALDKCWAPKVRGGHVCTPGVGSEAGQSIASRGEGGSRGGRAGVRAGGGGWGKAAHLR